MSARRLSLRFLMAAGCFIAAGCAKEQAASAPVAGPTIERGPEEVPLAVSAEGLLRDGAVVRIQEALEKEGFSVALTGELDGQTQRALLRFQDARGLAETGFPGIATIRALGLSPKEVFVTREGGAVD